jgi:hypothetical protein
MAIVLPFTIKLTPFEVKIFKWKESLFGRKCRKIKVKGKT